MCVGSFFARAFVVVLVTLLVVFEGPTIFVLFGGALFAIFIKTVAEFLVRHVHMPYKLAVFQIILLMIGATVVVVVTAGPSLAHQADNLVVQLPAALHTTKAYLAKHFGDGQLVPKDADLHPAAKTVIAGAGGALTGSAEALAALVIVAFVGLYGAFSPAAYARIALTVVPPARRERARQVMRESVHRLGRWLVGRAVAMIFVAVATTIGLLVLHVPLALALGVLAGALAFVEYIGAIASAAPPILLALTESPIKALWVVFLFFLVHLVEGYVLTPLIARTAVHFPPAFTLALQALFGAVFGVIGLTFATPSGIVLVTVIELLYVQDVLGPAVAAQKVSRTLRSTVE